MVDTATADAGTAATAGVAADTGAGAGTTVADDAATAAAATSTAADAGATSGSDDFPVDESVLATLPPESRSVVEPILKGWKDSFSKARTKDQEMAKTLQVDSQTLKQLKAHPGFVDWYRRNTDPVYAQQKVQEDRARYLEETRGNAPPEPVVSPEEYAEAFQNPAKMSELVQRQIQHAAQTQLAPLLRQQQENQSKLALQVEMDQMFRDHPDALDLDKAGVLEPFVYYYRDLAGRPLKEAYAAARKAHDLILSKAKNEAIGIVAGKKAAVAEKPAAVAGEAGVVYANSPEEARRMQIEAAIDGRKVEVRFRRKEAIR